MLARRTALGCALALSVLAFGAAPAFSQNFTKQVHIIVPYAPGGTSDIIARIIGPKLSEAIGQPVIVENKPSSSGNVGADFVAKAPPDGHTLLITDAGTLATQPNLVKKLSFDVQKDLVPVTLVTMRWQTTPWRHPASCRRICSRSSALKKSRTRVTESAALVVCNVESTRCPVSAALMAAVKLTESRISPIMMMSGSWRRTFFSA